MTVGALWVQRDFYAEAIAFFTPLRPSSTCTARPASSRPSNPAASVGATVLAL